MHIESMYIHRLIKSVWLTTSMTCLYSLNNAARQRQKDLIKVNNENMDILQRIQCTESKYNYMQWLNEWRLHNQYMTNISKYPHSWIKNIRVKAIVQNSNHELYYNLCFIWIVENCAKNDCNQVTVLKKGRLEKFY